MQRNYVSFEQLVDQMYRKMSGDGQSYLGATFLFSSMQAENDLFIPVLEAHLNPPWKDGTGRETGILLFEVNGIDWYRSPYFQFDFFDAYDFDVDKLGDPSIIEDLERISAKGVLVPSDIDGTRSIGSWVADGHVRSRINEYFEARKDYKRRKQVEKYMMLRQAPFNTVNDPISGRYTYQGVAQEASKHPSAPRAFTEHDLRWLQDYTRNRGIPIPSVQ